jgi:serine/threonine protein phosphatase 1
VDWFCQLLILLLACVTHISDAQPKTYVIGDIHGCALAFFALVNELPLRPIDTVVTLGDYVDRGPRSADVFKWLFKLRERCKLVPILGNHDLAMLQAWQSPASVDYWLSIGGADTLRSYGKNATIDSVPQAHIDFLRECALYHETDTHFFVHANYVPELSLDEQNEVDLLWISLQQRLPGPHKSGKIAIVGHTTQAKGEILDLPHLKCLDTGCCYNGWLTCLELTTGQIWQVNDYAEWRRSEVGEDD